VHRDREFFEGLSTVLAGNKKSEPDFRFAREKEVADPDHDLPPAVQKTVAVVSKGATIKGFSQEVENGQTLYEAEMSVNGHSKDVNMDSSGGVVEVEEQVEMDSLPTA
jgi:hypothetical protein